MSEQKKSVLKWFWRVNYALSVFTLLYALHIPFLDQEGARQPWFQMVSDVLSVGGLTDFFAPTVELLQVPVCFILLLVYKQERTFAHWIYLLFLPALCFVKFVILVVFLGGHVPG